MKNQPSPGGATDKSLDDSIAPSGLEFFDDRNPRLKPRAIFFRASGAKIWPTQERWTET
jgi:hypothetical protein